MVAKGKESLVCELEKSLYGLKQAPLSWHWKLIDFLRDKGSEKLRCESCIYIRTSGGETEIVAIYVDDLLLITKNKATMKMLKERVASGFKSKDVGEVHYILGLKVKRHRANRKLWIDQEVNADNVIKKFNMENVNLSETPTASGAKLMKTQYQAPEVNDKPFRQAVGSIMYLMTGSRPDLVYAT